MCSVGSGIFLKSTCCTLQHVVKIKADIASILNDEFFGHTVDTPNEDIEQHKKDNV